MPLTSKGASIKSAMTKEYGEKRGTEIFYASKNKGTISGVDSAKLDAACTVMDAVVGIARGDVDESYWTYKAAGPTPEHRDLPSGVFKGTEKQWHSLSPGMRREIARQAERSRTKIDAACAKMDALAK